MTSLKEHTGRPEIASWLRGWVDPEQQTTVVWRRHLPLRIGENGRAALPSKSEIEDFFEAAPPHESEKLETETYRVVSWLAERAEDALAGKPEARTANENGDASIGAQATDRDTDESQTGPAAPEAEKLKRGDIVVLILSPGGAFEGCCTLGELAQERKGKAKEEFHEALVGRLIVVDARFGGLSAGLLQPRSAAPADTADALETWSRQAGFRVQQAVSLPDEERDGWSVEHSLALRCDDEGTVQEWLVVEHFKAAAQSEDARAISRPQELGQHQDWARDRMERIARGVGLPAEAAAALALGALLHDEGKRAERWQRAFRAARDAEKCGLRLPLAKTRGPINQAILARYRHELGSLLALEENDELKALPEEWRDLVLHLVAAHHGQARPLIETRGCEDAPPSALEKTARAVAMRFARLQRRWGPWGLAWWEALLRAADVQASRENDAGEGGVGNAADVGAPRGERATAEG
jgi:CRISPR-associated endonuclease/helicase Cas3